MDSCGGSGGSSLRDADSAAVSGGSGRGEEQDEQQQEGGQAQQQPQPQPRPMDVFGGDNGTNVLMLLIVLVAWLAQYTAPRCTC